MNYEEIRDYVRYEAHQEFVHDSCENCGASYINQFDPETGDLISLLHECHEDDEDDEDEYVEVAGWSKPDEETLPNAHPIAAAPELYAALEDMLWPISAGCQKPAIARCKCAKCVEDRARAALAKARGKLEVAA